MSAEKYTAGSFGHEIQIQEYQLTFQIPDIYIAFCFFYADQRHDTAM